MVRRVGVGLVAALMVAASAAAQPLGTFQFQLLPYCNVISVSIVQQGGQYQLDGTDNQCGAGPRASVTGLAFPNPSGLLGFGFTIVTAPGGAPVHVDADLNLATFIGSWRDSAGHQGTFPLLFGAPTAGAPRPSPVIGDIAGVTAGAGLSGGGTSGTVALAVDFAAAQQRVTGTCTSGQLMTGVNQDGTVTCQSAVGSGGGDITAVIAGSGLTGGATTGDATLAVSFSGPGAATTAARSDHTHTDANSNLRIGTSAAPNNVAFNNVALGAQAMQLNTTGGGNVAIGQSALQNGASAATNVAIGYESLQNGQGSGNTAVGYFAGKNTTSGVDNAVLGRNTLSDNSSGSNNSTVGAQALTANTTGNGNTALGRSALIGNTTGSNNVAVGASALGANVSGNNNVALGQGAGANATGSNNVYVAAAGTAGESNVIRIGGTHTSAFMAGINGATSSGGVAVFVNASGQLGTATSSRRFKDDITALDESFSARVQALRPVSFVYKPAYDDGTRQVQYGLIAEEVAEVFPELVVRDTAGQVQTVRYHFLAPLLLAEVQRLERERAAAEADRTRLEDRVRRLEETLAAVAARR